MKYIISILFLIGCSKEYIRPTANKYQLYIDQYNIDTTILHHRTLWAQYHLTAEQNNYGMDTARDMFFNNCNTLLIEHVYYVVDGVKSDRLSFPEWPKDFNPEILDTNFVNYK